MRYLIDTNILVFLTAGDYDSIKDTHSMLFDYGNTLYTSSLSIMEIIYLQKSKKIKLKFKSPEEIYKVITETLNISIIQTKPEHLKTYINLSIAPEHKDQIDHLIISQAITEKIPLISSDHRFKEYRGLDFIFNKR